ncbi:hypothetical protein V6N12_071116 [Hibiscus sabdariffa]|uniref:Uncharacterized protein n=1 Tax=Hibiscus sabdariffa TaxID=183260 RepID=A0ABR2FJ20_9ROSI
MLLSRNTTLGHIRRASHSMEFTISLCYGVVDAMAHLVLSGSLDYSRWMEPPLAVCDKLLIDEGHTVSSGITDASRVSYSLH